MDIFLDRIKNDAITGNLKHLKFLIDVMEVNPHIEHEFALRWACREGHYDMVKYLVEEQGSNIHVLNEAPVEWALYFGHMDIVNYLVEHGAKVLHHTTLKCNKKFKNLLHKVRQLEANNC